MLTRVASYFGQDGEAWTISRLERWDRRADVVHQEHLAVMTPEARKVYQAAMEAARGRK